MRKYFVIIFLILSTIVSGTTYYVAPSTATPAGNDASSGDINHPWLTWGKAFHTAQAGDTVFFRGGTYYTEAKDGRGIKYSPVDRLGYDGTAANPICYFNYAGEIPVLDCSGSTATYDDTYNYGLFFIGVDFVHIKGLQIKNVEQRPNRFDVCVGLYNKNSNHLKLENMDIGNVDGYAFRTIAAYHAEIINCDAHDCCDYFHQTMPGNWGGGFGGGNGSFSDGYVIYYGCRAWMCSDQGFCASGSISLTVFEKCWSYDNGKMVGNVTGEGHGYKLGYFATLPTIDPVVIMKNCISTNNLGNGITGNENIETYAGAYQLYNNLSYNNGRHGFVIRGTCSTDDMEYKRVLRNNISYISGTAGNGVDFNTSSESVCTHSNNSWDQAVTVTAADFNSLDYSQLKQTRKADGSLPDVTFGKLVSGSDLIDKGLNVGYSFYGTAPDLGYSEYNSGTPTPVIPVYASSLVANSTPARLEMTYNVSLANIIPAASAFIVKVNSVVRNVSTVVISANKVVLTLATPVAYGDRITVTYTKPAASPLQTLSGGQAASITDLPVANNLTAPANKFPVVSISSPAKSETFTTSATITIDVLASDPDGSISKVEFYVGSTKIGQCISAPYSFKWSNVTVGTYSLTAVAYDNLNASTTSSAISVIVTESAATINQLPVVNITYPGNDSSFDAPANITFTADASDTDGTISKVEFYYGTTKIGESQAYPYSVSFEFATAGTYQIKAVATDDMNAVASSTTVNIVVNEKREYTELVRLYPNPNNGIFSIEIVSPLPGDRVKLTIVSVFGKTVYNGILTNEEYIKQMNMPYIKAGTYVLMLTHKNNIISTVKFVKE